MNESRSTPTPARGAWRSPVMLDDLTADLIWPRLLKAGPLSLRPGRLALAFFYLAGLAAIVTLADKLDGHETSVLAAAGAEWAGHLHALLHSCFQADAAGVGQAVIGLYIGTLWDLVSAHPVIAILFVPLILVWTTLMGGAISRIAAMDFAQGVGLSWPQGLGYALGRWASFAGSIAGPLALAYGILLFLAVAGWVLFSLPGLNVVGGALWFLFLFAGAIVSVVLLAMTLGGPMLVPAVSCEGTDAIDAVQHAYSYVFARPLRLVAYTAILAAVFVLLWLVVAAAVWLTVHIPQNAATTWLSAPGSDAVAGAEGLAGSHAIAASGVRFWSSIALLLAGSFAVSYFWCAATVLYLAMRRLCDGQDMSEVWVDTIVPGTMAERKQPPSSTAGADAIVDNGPADET